jgi:UDP-glucose 4-epimerase
MAHYIQHPNMKVAERVLLVGGFGFIGRHVLRALITNGADVSVMDVVPAPTEFRDIHHVIGSAADPSLMSSVASGKDIVIFLANSSLPGSANSDLSSEVAAHVQVTIKAAEICNAVDVRRLIFASSGGTVYGYSSQAPLSEDMPTQPLNAYGVSKLSIEHYLRILSKHRPMQSVSLRISNPYGEEQRANRNQGFIAAAMEHAFDGRRMHIWGDGSVERDFIHVSDVASAFVAACRVAIAPPVVNIGTGVALSLNDGLAQVENVTKRQILVTRESGRSIDVARNVLDISLARRMLDWHPQITFEQGLKRTADWWREHSS